MSITLATKLAVALAFASPLAAAPWVAGGQAERGNSAGSPAAIEIAPGDVDYRAAGEFTRAGRPVVAPMRRLTVAQPLRVMTHQVSGADYQRCVDASACKPLAADVAATADRPAVQVSFRDAERYAVWLSRATGEDWRLPSDAEWAYVAGSRWRDDAVVIDADDPSRRALARYERESAARDDVGDGEVHAVGHFGANERGIVDVAGNVWEWTSTCYTRAALDRDGAGTTENCGVRVVEGRHRAYVTDFIRDARGGGCSAGVPPIHLGFRLVREPRSWRGWLIAKANVLRTALR